MFVINPLPLPVKYSVHEAINMVSFVQIFTVSMKLHYALLCHKEKGLPVLTHYGEAKG